MRRNPATLELSAISIAEMAIKHNKGNLNLRGEDVLEGVRRFNITVLSWNAEHAFQLFNMAQHHGDPFDRQIIAQALAEDLPVITPDPAFSLYRGLKVIW